MRRDRDHRCTRISVIVRECLPLLPISWPLSERKEFTPKNDMLCDLWLSIGTRHPLSVIPNKFLQRCGTVLEKYEGTFTPPFPTCTLLPFPFTKRHGGGGGEAFQHLFFHKICSLVQTCVMSLCYSQTLLTINSYEWRFRCWEHKVLRYSNEINFFSLHWAFYSTADTRKSYSAPIPSAP